MKELLKLFLQVIKEQRQLKKDLRRLDKANLDYEALQRIVDNVATKNVEIEVKMENVNITIKPTPSNEVGFTSFKEKYQRYQTSNN